MVKNPPAVPEGWVRSLGGEDPPEKDMAAHSSVLARKSHGERSLVGHSPWVAKEGAGRDLATKQQAAIMTACIC